MLDGTSFICTQNIPVIEYVPTPRKSIKRKQETEDETDEFQELKKRDIGSNVHESTNNPENKLNEKTPENTSLNCEVQNMQDLIEKRNQENVLLTTEISNKNCLIKTQKESIEILQKEKEMLQNDLKTKDEKIEALTLQLKSYEAMYQKPVTASVIVNDTQRKTLNRFITFTNTFSSMPQSRSSKEKLLNKKMHVIKQYEANSQHLLEKCKL